MSASVVAKARKPWDARRIVRLLIGLSLGYALLLGLARLVTPRLLFPAPHSGRTPTLAGAELWRLSGDAGQAVALFVAPSGQQAASRPVFVFFHGNGEELADVVTRAGRLASRGSGMLAVEYPGYGLCADQTPSERTLYEAAERALAELASRGFAPDRVVLVGQSLGSGVAAEMALRGRGSRLVLISPYTSIPDMAARIVPFLPLRLIVRDQFDTLDKAPRISIPVLVIHGDRDTLIPVQMGRMLSETFPHAEFSLRVGRGHNDVWQDPQLIDIVLRFGETLSN